MAHGVDDTMVPVECSRRVVEFLKEQGYRPIYLEYPMGHEINEVLLAELTTWVTKVFSSRLPGSC
jgi:predicted esterase